MTCDMRNQKRKGNGKCCLALGAWRCQKAPLADILWATETEQKQNRPRTYEIKRGDKKGMENAAWRLALGAVRKLHQGTHLSRNTLAGDRCDNREITDLTRSWFGSAWVGQVLKQEEAKELCFCFQMGFWEWFFFAVAGSYTHYDWQQSVATSVPDIVYTVMTAVRLVPQLTAIWSDFRSWQWWQLYWHLCAHAISTITSVPIRHEHSFEHTRVCNLIMCNLIMCTRA